jgi:hypothetical protein
MRLRLAFAFLFALFAVLSAMAQTDAIDAKQAVIILVHRGSEGQVRVNGIPILFFASNPTLGDGPLTDSLGTFSTFARNGPNVVTVDAAPEKGQTEATTTISAMVATGSLDDLDKPPLFKETITGRGKAEKTIVLKNVPEWAFLKVQPFTGNKDDVLVDVRALHKAFAGHDAKAVQAAFKPMYDDLLPYFGAAVIGSPAQFARQMSEMAATAIVQPLPADLKVESGYGDRLFVVTTAGGKAPIRAASKSSKGGPPELTMETGSYWIHRPDGWFVIRR